MVEKVQTHMTHLTVTRIYQLGRVVTKEESEEHPIEVRCHPPEVPLASVGATSSMTINLGNFESVKLGASITLPCCVEEIAECYETTKQFLNGRIDKECREIKEYRDQKAKDKG